MVDEVATSGDEAAPELTASDASGEPDASEADAEPAAAATGADATPEPVADPAAPLILEPAVPPVAPPLADPRRSAFFPALLGGVLAAGLGAGALYYSDRAGWIDLGGSGTEALRAAISEQSAQLATLEAALSDARGDIAALRDAKPDLSAVEQAIAGVSGDLADRAATLGARIDATDARIADVETQPIPKAELPAEVVAAFEAQLARVQETLDARFAGAEARLDAKLAEIEAAQAAAALAEQGAADAVRLAEARAALARVDAALDAGSGFAEALGALTAGFGIEPPAALAAIADTGAPTLSGLQDSFDAAARAALVASTRAAAEDGRVDRLTAFFRTQLGARSLQPREGDDPDAILSRADAALGKGELDAALAEIAALPQAGQAELAGWIATAETRRAAKAASRALSDQLNPN